MADVRRRRGLLLWGVFFAVGAAVFLHFRSSRPVASADQDDTDEPAVARVEPKRRSAPPRFDTQVTPGVQQRQSASLGFEDEARDEQWAAAMETVLRRKWSTAVLSQVGLDDLQVLELECRS